jgi:transcriptional regulator with XRE-family HTH domain
MRGKAHLPQSNPYRLTPSPLTLLRQKHGLSMSEAAIKIGCDTLRVARIEAATRRLPAKTWRSIADALMPPEKYYQPTIFDVIRADGEVSGG